MTEEELYKKVISYFPNANYEIIEWDGKADNPITIKCLDCGTIKTFSRIYGLWKKKTRFCTTCSETLSQRKVRDILSTKGLEFLEWNNDIDNNGKTIYRVKFRCSRCGQVTDRRVWEVLHSCDECSFCGIGHRRKKPDNLFRKEIEDLFPKQYELLGEYLNSKEKIPVRHQDCGFIFQISPDNLLRGKGCPRCNRYNSKGVKKIRAYLENNQIKYETEKIFDWSNKKRYDFYIPKDNLLIEFNGEQHYTPIPFFTQSRSFEEQQKSDIFKKQAALAHGYNFLVIKYDQISDIPTILSNSTTIPQEVEVEKPTSKK